MGKNSRESNGVPNVIAHTFGKFPRVVPWQFPFSKEDNGGLGTPTTGVEPDHIIGMDVAKSGSDYTMSLDIDVSKALTGLKAVTREAKAATRALKEMECAYERATGISGGLSDYSTDELCKELVKRKGAQGFVFDPSTIHRGQCLQIAIGNNIYDFNSNRRTRILVITD